MKSAGSYATTGSVFNSRSSEVALVSMLLSDVAAAVSHSIDPPDADEAGDGAAELKAPLLLPPAEADDVAALQAVGVAPSPLFEAHEL